MPAGIAGGLRGADLTYTEAGATKGVIPPGYHHLHRTVTIGTGAQAFTAATDALAGWHVHGRAGLSVSASLPAAEPGSVLVLSLGLAAIRIGAPCRVVYVIDEPGRRGFAYGTLPGHPRARRGSLHRQPAPGATVTFSITAFSSPATPLAKAAGPLGRAIQRHITSRYQRAITR